VGAVDERFGEIEFAASFQVLRQSVQDPIERAVTDPVLKSPMTCLIRRVTGREILPRRTSAKDPKHPVKDVARVAIWTSSHACRRRLLDGEERPQKLPLLIGEVHRNL
jgi:hypothetical protein